MRGEITFKIAAREKDWCRTYFFVHWLQSLGPNVEMKPPLLCNYWEAVRTPCTTATPLFAGWVALIRRGQDPRHHLLRVPVCRLYVLVFACGYQRSCHVVVSFFLVVGYHLDSFYFSLDLFGDRPRGKT